MIVYHTGLKIAILSMPVVFESGYRHVLHDHFTIINDVSDDLLASHFHSIVQQGAAHRVLHTQVTPLLMQLLQLQRKCC